MIRLIIDLKPASKSASVSDNLNFIKAVREQVKLNGIEMLDGILGLNVTFVYPRLSRSLKENPERTRKTSQASLSNLWSRLDKALSNALYLNSNCLTDLNLSKVYAGLNEKTHIDITVYELPYRVMNDTNKCTKYTLIGGGEHARTREERRANNVKAHKEEAEKRLIESRQLREERRIKNRQALDEERAEAKRLKEEENKKRASFFSLFKAVDDE